MLSKEIQEFVEEMKQLNAIGCLLVDQKDVEKLMTKFQQASILVSPEPQLGKVTYSKVDLKTPLTAIRPPALLIVTEEDYSQNSDWAETIRSKAAYFMHVG